MKRERILIIEDEKKIADMLQLGLSENDYQADVAYNRTVGYDMFKKNQYGLVILDINLPGMGGYDLCRYMRTSNASIPIIVITSLIDLDDKINAYNLGAD